MSPRKTLLLLIAVATMVGLAALSLQKKPADFPLLDWANAGNDDAPPAAILIEMGLKDKRTRDWSGSATVSGAKLVHREGYRFRKTDELVGSDAWKAKSHLALRAPRNPAIALLEGVATVGVVLHLRDIDEGAKLTLRTTGEDALSAEVALDKVVAGTPTPIWDGRAVVRLVTTASRLSDGPTEDDFPAAAHAPDGTLWVAYIRYHLVEEGRRIESKQLPQQPKHFEAMFTPEFRDELVVRYRKGGKWSKPIPITNAKQDLVRCAIAAEGDGEIWVFYSAQRNGRHHIHTRKITLRDDKPPSVGDEVYLHTASDRNLSPVACTDSTGTIQFACQSANHGRFGIEWRHLADNRLYPTTIVEGFRNQWSPAVAAGPDGAKAVAFDDYDKGDYDIVVYTKKGKDKAKRHMLADSTKFEARPSMVYDRTGLLWIAYEEGPENWGKDYGALDTTGHPLYSIRNIKVVCQNKGQVSHPSTKLPKSNVQAPRIPFDRIKTNKFERGERYTSPTLGLDGKGRLWLCYRKKFGSRYSSHPGSYWISYVRMLDVDKWTEPIEIHHSDGLLDYRPVLLPHPSGGLTIVHNSDGRYTLPETVHNRVYCSYVSLPGKRKHPLLRTTVTVHPPKPKNPASTKNVDSIRTYQARVAGKSYRLLRGEFHRHTEVSWDGGADGSLEDMFRYALDAAGMDWIGNGDHDNGAGREYPWWLTQKLTDAYHIPKKFTPMFTYERSVSYPHGHRNCMFAKRGVRTLPRLAQPKKELKVAGIHADDTKMLYRYLKELDGICAVHTSATGMGTDWRDNDPLVEPIVEIYQGDRMSYEKQAAPRAGYNPQTGKKPANIGGWRPKGYIDNAFAKGYKLGFQASSDHWSTHISYCIVLSETHDRDGILDAMKKRHCYGATDDIVLNVMSQDKYLQGDAFTTTDAPSLKFHIRGTAPLARIDIVKDSEVVHTIEGKSAQFSATWIDPKPSTGTHYYYVRVLQKDNEIAWSSPMWITRRGE